MATSVRRAYRGNEICRPALQAGRTGGRQHLSNDRSVRLWLRRRGKGAARKEETPGIFVPHRTCGCAGVSRHQRRVYPESMCLRGILTLTVVVRSSQKAAIIDKTGMGDACARAATSALAHRAALLRARAGARNGVRASKSTPRILCLGAYVSRRAQIGKLRAPVRTGRGNGLALVPASLRRNPSVFRFRCILLSPLCAAFSARTG